MKKVLWLLLFAVLLALAIAKYGAARARYERASRHLLAGSPWHSAGLG